MCSIPALRDSILLRTLSRDSDGLDAHGSHAAHDLGVEDGISVQDEVLDRRLVREGLPELLDHPVRRWVGRDIEVEDLPATVLDDEESVEQTERGRRDDKEVHGREDVAMVTEKSLPALALLRVCWSPWHQPGNRCLPDFVAELEQLAMDPRRAPVVLGCHLADEVSDLGFGWRTTGFIASLRLPSPVEPEALPMPSDDRVRLHDDQCRPPSGPGSAHQHPEELVWKVHPRLRFFLNVDTQLLTEGKVLEDQILTGLEKGTQGLQAGLCQSK